MKPNVVTATLIAVLVVVAAVGAIEAFRNDDGDLVACFVALLVVGVVQGARLVVGRPSVPLRADLVRWLAERSRLTGEPISRVADRAVATYRASLVEQGSEPAVEREAGAP